MPSLFRFLLIGFIVAVIVSGAMWALVNYVEPQPREMTQNLSPSRLNPK